MEKKNTVLLMVIALATLIVAMVGATFAYFASQIDVENTTMDVTATTPASASSFTASGGSEITLTLTAADMLEEAKDDSTPIKTASNSDALVLSALSGDANTTMTCTYDIVWVWKSGDGIDLYVPSTGLDEGQKEFTVKVTKDEEVVLEETRFEEATADGEVVLLDDAIIENASAGDATTQNYFVTVGFYNTEFDQKEEQAGKTFKGTVKIVPADKPCTYSSN